MEDSITLVEGTDHTLKELASDANKNNKVLVIVDTVDNFDRHTPLIEKIAISSSGLLVCALSQLLASEQQRLEKRPQSDTEELSKYFSRTMDLVPTALISPNNTDQRREVKHPNAKPITRTTLPKKNYQFRKR